MSTALTTTSAARLPDAAQLAAMLQFADTLLKSGLLPQHIKSPAAAFAVIQKGSELGIPPMYALSNIAVIQGKPTANAELMQALIYRDQGDDALRFTETTDTVATIAYKRRGWPKAERFSFSLEDAKRAGLLSNQTWQKYPGAMLRARAVSAVARLAFADSIGGLYTAEELGAAVIVNSDGAVEVAGVPEREATDTSTGEITTLAPRQITGRAASMPDIGAVRFPQETGHVDDGEQPAGNKMYAELVALISECRALGDDIPDPKPGLKRGEARALRIFLIDLLDGLKAAAPEPVEVRS